MKQIVKEAEEIKQLAASCECRGKTLRRRRNRGFASGVCAVQHGDARECGSRREETGKGVGEWRRQGIAALVARFSSDRSDRVERKANGRPSCRSVDASKCVARVVRLFFTGFSSCLVIEKLACYQDIEN